MKNTKKKSSKEQNNNRLTLKRYPKHVVLAYARLLAKDPKSIEFLMSVDDGPYTVTKP